LAIPTDYTQEQIEFALRECGGYLTGVAKMLGTTYEAIRLHIRNNADLHMAQLDYREELLDTAEKGLRKAVFAEKPWAIKFVLARLGKGRGYGQTIEIDIPADSVSRVVVYLPDDGRESKPDGSTTATRTAGNSVTE